MAFQWEDWTETRFSSRTSPEYRKAVAKLAERMHRVNTALEATAVTIPMPAVQETDDDLGFVDIIAQSEQAFPQWSSTLEKLSQEITEIGEIMGAAGEAIQDGVKRAEPYSARLAFR